MNYQISFNGVAVTAMNILHGLDLHTHWETFQPAWARNGMGFIEFHSWLATIAEHSEQMLHERQPEGFPGVYDYEVSHELGKRILTHVTTTGQLPSDEDVLHWLTALADEFFSQGGDQ
jgi:hypothetical protein